MAGDDRTEAATPRRLQRARDAGQVALSREVPALAGLGVGTLILASMGAELGEPALARLGQLISLPPGSSVGTALMASCLAIAVLAGPVVMGVLAAGVAASILQTGVLFSPQRLQPDFARLNPIRGLGRIFGPTGLFEAAKATVKLAAFGFTAYRVLARELRDVGHAMFWPADQLAARAYHAALRVAAATLLLQAVIAVLDVVWVRRRHARQLRMSKEEVRQDARDADGNPQVKQRLRQMRLLRSRKRMLAAVPAATVVVTNPTHYAVALAYDSIKGGAPRVVAKGMDEVAARIREVARDNRVPLVANPPLARALYTVEVDSEIPAEHFKVVAEIIAYVWRLSGRMSRL